MEHTISDSKAQAAVDAWSRLSDLSDDSYYQNWLELQTSLIDGSYLALLSLPAEGEQFGIAARYPQYADHQELAELVNQVLEQQSGMVCELALRPSEQGEAFGVAYPLIHEGRTEAVIALGVMVQSQEALQRVMRQLQWGLGWLELQHQKQRSDQIGARQQALSGSVELLAKVLAERSYDAAASRFVTDLAVTMQCDRVSLGIPQQNRVVVEHLSHSAQFGRKMNLVRLIESAMEESLDQQQVISWPANSEGGEIALAHQALSRDQGGAQVVTIPLFSENEVIACLTLERADIPFSDADVIRCESIAGLISVALDEKRLNDRSLWAKIKDSVVGQLGRVFGVGYLGRKLLLLLFIAIFGFGWLAEGEYRLSADASLENVIQRVVTAPYNGYIQAATLRAGDLVRENQELARLDDRDLKLERLKWLSETSKLQRQYQEATAGYDRAQINVLNAQLDQARAQLALVEGQLKRASIRAPFEGLIVSGDLSQRLGGAVEQGEVLFEVSPRHFYRIDLMVRESRIADVRIGQEGVLHLSALPDRGFPFIVTKLTPQTRAKDGSTFFVVEASLQDHSEQMQPGMEGVGKIGIDKRSLLSIWSRELVEWVRLKIWSWWG